MPEISRFFGIRIFMFYRDHSPPHFHARYGDDQASIAIDSLLILGGELPGRALGLVVEWATKHQSELLDDWERARKAQPLRPIDPLG